LADSYITEIYMRKHYSGKTIHKQYIN